MTVEFRLVLIGILAFAGCATAPEQPSKDPALPAAEAAAAAQASATAAASNTERGASDAAVAATVEGAPEIAVATLADTNPVTCRDMLVQGSNQMRTRCMTRNDWKVFDQAQRIWAQDMLMRMQGLRR